jgi:hypothetical protein
VSHDPGGNFTRPIIVSFDLTALLYAPSSSPRPAGKPSFTEVGSLPDFFVRNTVFPVDGYIITDAAAFVIKPMV